MSSLWCCYEPTLIGPSSCVRSLWSCDKTRRGQVSYASKLLTLLAPGKWNINQAHFLFKSYVFRRNNEWKSETEITDELVWVIDPGACKFYVVTWTPIYCCLTTFCAVVHFNWHFFFYSIPIAAGHFDRDVYMEANKKWDINIGQKNKNQKNSLVCTIQ